MKKRGFTLIEVLIATSIISVVFTTLASIVAVSLRNTSANTKRIIGVHMADGLQEWIRGERDQDWEAFKTKTGTWCFNDEVVNSWPNNAVDDESGCQYHTGTNNFPYKRVVTIARDGLTDVYKSKIDFIWEEGTNVNKVTNETYYSQW